MQIKKYVLCILLVVCFTIMLCSCKGNNNMQVDDKSDNKITELPLPEPDETTEFGVDKNINQSTIDLWLGRDDVVYRDMRMLVDPGHFWDVGLDPDLSRTFEGFKVVPYPYLGTLQEMPVEGAYDGDVLFEVVWTDDGHIASATPMYEESMLIMEELFQKDKAIFLMCGAGGYANMTRELLLTLGWDANKIYHIGGNSDYTGSHGIDIIESPNGRDGEKLCATWRADYAYIDFSLLHKIK